MARRFSGTRGTFEKEILDGDSRPGRNIITGAESSESLNSHSGRTRGSMRRDVVEQNKNRNFNPVTGQDWARTNEQPKQYRGALTKNLSDDHITDRPGDEKRKGAFKQSVIDHNDNRQLDLISGRPKQFVEPLPADVGNARRVRTVTAEYEADKSGNHIASVFAAESKVTEADARVENQRQEKVQSLRQRENVQEVPAAHFARKSHKVLSKSSSGQRINPITGLPEDAHLKKSPSGSYRKNQAELHDNVDPITGEKREARDLAKPLTSVGKHFWH